MIRVLGITSGLQQASARLRLGELVAPLRDRSIDLQIAKWPSGWLARRGLLRSSRDFDAVILQRRLLDPSFARLLRRNAKTIFFDVDDAVMYHAGNVGPWSRWRTDRRFAATCGVLDHVVAGNAYLADIFRARGCDVSTLPTTVDPRHYRVRTHQPTDAVKLVWIGSKSTIDYLDAVLPALGEAAKQSPGLRLTIIADRSIDHAPLPIDFVPWSEAAEVEALAAADIGIAPTPTDRWTLGKCGFKIIQCMAAGLPVVASPVGANAVIVREGETGYLAADASDWPGAIARLAGDVNLRAKLGAAGRRDVWSIYNVERAADFWARLFSSLLPPGENLG